MLDVEVKFTDPSILITMIKNNQLWHDYCHRLQFAMRARGKLNNAIRCQELSAMFYQSVASMRGIN